MSALPLKAECDGKRRRGGPGTMAEQAATILLPNSLARGGTGRYGGAVESAFYAQKH
jgi:hypothetical protein